MSETPHRLLLWRNLEGWRGWATTWRAEVAEVELGEGRLSARGTQLGVEPSPYRLHYRLSTSERWITESLLLTVLHDGQERQLLLEHDGAGSWTADGEPLPEVQGALDCDLAYSPLTNTMPVLREGIRDGRGPVDFTMAWVDVPALTVHASPQRYEPVDASTVRYVTVGDDFQAELELDDDGLAIRYPYLAQRVDAGSLGSA